MRAAPSTVDLVLAPVHRWVWSDVQRRARKLLTFSETEADGAHDISRAAELTRDPSLRLLYLRHAADEKVLACDPQTRAVFARILKDEEYHMTYTRKQLARLAPRKQGLRLWQARAGRLWNVYLRVATALAGLLGTVILAIQYFLILPVFALLARRAARREPEGFFPSRAAVALERQY